MLFPLAAVTNYRKLSGLGQDIYCLILWARNSGGALLCLLLLGLISLQSGDLARAGVSFKGSTGAGCSFKLTV